MERVFALYRLTHGPEGPEGLLAALRLTAAAASLDHGCRSARVFQQADDSGGVLLVQEWNTTGDLERHIRAPKFRRILATLELSRTPPDVVYVEGSKLRGIEWIAEVRGVQNN